MGKMSMILSCTAQKQCCAIKMTQKGHYDTIKSSWAKMNTCQKSLVIKLITLFSSSVSPCSAHYSAQQEVQKLQVQITGFQGALIMTVVHVYCRVQIYVCFLRSTASWSVGGHGFILQEPYIIYELPCLNRDKDSWAQLLCQTLQHALQERKRMKKFTDWWEEGGGKTLTICRNSMKLGLNSCYIIFKTAGLWSLTYNVNKKHGWRSCWWWTPWPGSRVNILENDWR